MKIFSFFVIPCEYYNLETKIMCLMPDNDLLPLDILPNAYYLWTGEIASRNNQLCVLLKLELTVESVLEMHHQTTCCKWFEMYDNIEKRVPDLSEEFKNIAVENMGLSTIRGLDINKIYAGRTIEEVGFFFPELIGKINDIDIA